MSENELEIGTSEKPINYDEITNELDGVDKQAKPGIIYISRIPPGMTPSKVRAIMAQHGEIGRIFLAPAPNSNIKNPRFTEGWVEFKKRKIAKKVAELLNAQPIGGKKGDRYRDDIWTMKYLGGGFKWSMLSEHIALEQATHTAKLRNELSQSKKEQEEYLRRIEKAKKLTAIEERKQKKGISKPSDDNQDDQKQFKQRQVFNKDELYNKKRKRSQAEDFNDKHQKLNTVLGNIF